MYPLVSKHCQLYDEIFDQGILSPVFHQPYIIVIPKAYYHPISVINVHTKILQAV